MFSAGIGPCILCSLAHALQESTRDLEMVHQSQRRGQSGTTMYDFDYIIDSTRGAKRVLSTVAISRQRLFIVNGNIKCRTPLCDEVGDVLASIKQSMSSFVDT